MKVCDILLIGIPGSGKGTQALKLVQKKSFFHLSTGDLFRYNLKEKSSLGLLAKSYIDKGQLVPDFLTQDMVRDFIKNIPQTKSIVWDGFPRNLSQSEAFDDILKKNNRSLTKVFYLKLSETEVIERLSGRLYAPKSGLTYHIKNKVPKKKGICDVSGETLISRSDDKKDVIKKRIAVFYEQTKALLNHYKQQNLLIEVEAFVKPDELFQKILNHFKSF